MAVQLKRIPTHEECKCDEFWRWNLLVWLNHGQGPKRRAPGSRMNWANSARACSDCLALTKLTQLGVTKCFIWGKVGTARRVTLQSRNGDPARKIYDYDDDDDDDEIYFEDAFSEMKSVIEFGSNRKKQSLFNSGKYIFCQYFEKAGLFFFRVLQIGVVRFLRPWDQLFEGRLALARPGLSFNPGFFFFCSKAFSQIIFSTFF